MDLLNQNKEKLTKKPEIEKVEQEKQEYKLIGTFLRTRGLKLYCYDHINEKLLEVNLIRSDTIHILPNEFGELRAVDLELEKAIVDSRATHFEALNMKNAEKRLRKWKQGKIKDLCNLRVPTEGIKFW